MNKKFCTLTNKQARRAIDEGHVQESKLTIAKVHFELNNILEKTVQMGGKHEIGILR